MILLSLRFAKPFRQRLTATRAAEIAAAWLQWSHTQSNVETWLIENISLRDEWASMEPRSVELGTPLSEVTHRERFWQLFE